LVGALQSAEAVQVEIHLWSNSIWRTAPRLNRNNSVADCPIMLKHRTWVHLMFAEVGNCWIYMLVHYRTRN